MTSTHQQLLLLGVLLPTMACRLHAADLLGAPYLCRPLPDGITVCWITNAQNAGEVEFQADGGAPSRAKAFVYEPQVTCSFSIGKAPGEVAGTYVAKARLTGLAPGTRYSYRVCGNGLSGEGTGTFRLPGPRDPVTISFVSDEAWLDDRDVSFLEKTAGEPIDLVVNAGDTPQHPELYQFAAAWQRRIPMIVIGGNQDILGDGLMNYVRRYFDFDDAATATFVREASAKKSKYLTSPSDIIDFGPTRWIMNPTLAFVSKERITWLEQALTTSSRPWNILVTHPPILTDATLGVRGDRQSKAGDPGNEAGAAPRKSPTPAWDLAMKHGVKLAVHGHIHTYFRTHPINNEGALAPGGVMNLDVASVAKASTLANQGPTVAAYGLPDARVLLKVDEHSAVGEVYGRPSAQGDYQKIDAFSLVLGEQR